MGKPSNPASAPAGAAQACGAPSHCDQPVPDAMVLDAIDACGLAFCLADDADRIRHANEAFCRAFAPGVPVLGTDFAEAVGRAIAAGRGVKLETLPLPEYMDLVREKRRSATSHRSFCIDMLDGSWWWVEEQRLANGWLLLTAADISQVKSEEMRLRSAHADAMAASQTDFLTGLPNRRLGMLQAELALERFRNAGEPCCLALIDIDRFKHINDLFGHEAGDDVLTHFADCLRRLCGTGDLPSRFGGEEFMLVMPGTNLQRGKQRLARLLRALPSLDRGRGRPPIRYGFSAGIVAPHAGDTLKSVLARADSALYAAKTNGRGRVESDKSHAADAA